MGVTQAESSGRDCKFEDAPTGCLTPRRADNGELLSVASVGGGAEELPYSLDFAHELVCVCEEHPHTPANSLLRGKHTRQQHGTVATSAVDIRLQQRPLMQTAL